MWWGQQLSQLLPDQLRRRNTALADALLIEPVGPLDPAGGHESSGLITTAPPRDHEVPTVDLVLRKGGQVSRLGRFTLDGHGGALLQREAAELGPPLPIWVSLPEGLLLEKQLSLPLAAERELARVVGYEMDRETPFSADEVYWDSTIEQRDRANGKLKLRLSLVPRAPLQRLVVALQRAGMAPVGLDAALPEGGTRRIAFAGAKRPRGVAMNRAVPVAALGCAALAIAAVIVPFVRQSIELSASESKIAALQPEVTEFETLRQRIDGSSSGRDALTAERLRLGNVLKVLATTTQVLPDDSYLTEFTMRQRKLTLAGQAASAPSLITKLSTDPTFQNPSFGAPVTHLPNQTLDVFTIVAEVKQ